MQYVTLEMSNKGGFMMVFTAIYGSNWQSRRSELWKDLHSVHQSHGTLPWAVAGDFNVVRFSNEKN